MSHTLLILSFIIHPAVASSLTVPKDGGVSTSSAKSPRKYSFFKQQSSSDGTKDEARPQRQYSYMHTVVSTPGDGARSGPGDSVRSGAGDGVKRGVGVSGKGGADNTPTTTQEVKNNLPRPVHVHVHVPVSCTCTCTCTYIHVLVPVLYMFNL